MPLAAGAAEISLSPIADADCTKDQGACHFGDRNIDAIILHPNASDVLRRINSTTGDLQCLSLRFYCQMHCLSLLITAFPCGSSGADPADGQVLPLDVLFSQQNEVFFKVQNMDATHNLSVTVPMTYDHAPYMGQHDYLNKTIATITARQDHRLGGGG